MIPEKAEDILLLAETIIAKHLHEGAESPLKMSYIAELSYKLKNAKHQHTVGMKFLKVAEAAFLERDMILGIETTPNANANADPAGTLKYLLGLIRETLSESVVGKEQKPEEWGFEVKQRMPYRRKNYSNQKT